MKKISIGKDFSETPIGRYPSDSDFSGQRFRDDYLVPALNDNELVEVAIDDVEGYGSSFLEEAFGGLIRKGYFTVDVLKKRLKITSKDSDFDLYGKLIWKYIQEAKLSVA